MRAAARVRPCRPAARFGARPDPRRSARRPARSPWSRWPARSHPERSATRSSRVVSRPRLLVRVASAVDRGRQRLATLIEDLAPFLGELVGLLAALTRLLAQVFAGFPSGGRRVEE